MQIIKESLILVVKFFFKVYFSIFGNPQIDKNLSKAISLYKGEGFIEEFAIIRAWDAPFKEIDNIVPLDGTIVDLGCGDGILANYLAISSVKRKLIGIELNKSRLKDADKGIKNASFEKGDIVKGIYPKADCIILSHVLHHLPNKKAQEKVISQTVSKLKKNGKLVIIEINTKPILKYIFTWLTDAFTVPIIFEKKLYDFSFRYRNQSDWEKLLLSYGYKYLVTFPYKGKPFSHIVFECTKN